MLKFRWKEQIINNIDNNIDIINSKTIMPNHECSLLSKHKSQNHIMAYLQVAEYGICSVAVYKEATYVAATITNITSGAVLEYRFYKNKIIIEHDFITDAVMKRLMGSITTDVYR